MEGDIDPFQWNRGKPALEVDWLWFGFGLLGAFVDNLHELGSDLFDRLRLDQRLNVNLLRFQEIGDICQAVQSAKLKEESAAEILIE